MTFNAKKGSLLILAVTALACSRTMFAFFDDPEGPNLLIVAGMAAVLYLLSLAFYLSGVCPSLAGFKRSAAAILIQLFAVAGFYLLLR